MNLPFPSFVTFAAVSVPMLEAFCNSSAIFAYACFAVITSPSVPVEPISPMTVLLVVPIVTLSPSFIVERIVSLVALKVDASSFSSFSTIVYVFASTPDPTVIVVSVVCLIAS